MDEARGFIVFKQGFAGPVHGTFNDSFAVDDDEFVVQAAAFINVENAQALAKQALLDVGAHEDAVRANGGLPGVKPEADFFAGFRGFTEGCQKTARRVIGLGLILNGEHGDVDGGFRVLDQVYNALKIGAVGDVFGENGGFGCGVGVGEKESECEKEDCQKRGQV